MSVIDTVLIFSVFAIPAAMVWALAYLLARRSRVKRLGLFALFFLIPAIWWETGTLILMLFALPATVLTVWLFEWAAAKGKA